MHKEQKSEHLPLWQEKGWTRRLNGDETIYTGKYCIEDSSGHKRTFKGKIVVERYWVYQRSQPGNTEERVETHQAHVYIIKPPSELFAHPRGSCLSLNYGSGRRDMFNLHFGLPPKDVNSAILYMENMLLEAFDPNKLPKS